MAKRKRLTPAQPSHFNTDQRAPETKSMPGLAPTPTPPIAQVAGEAATLAALDEVTAVLQDARRQGRLIEALPLAAINARYLVRDRLVQDDDEMSALIDSLRARGQQTPIEVTALPASDGPATYGLISGWRRLTALSRLYEETNDAQFASVKALVVTPGSAQDAYVAMVEENEIRVNLSLYERANIALRAAHEGVFPTPRHAVLGLFGSTPRSKRSKIGTFITLVEALDSVLQHPTAIPEKLGLGVAKALQDDPETGKKLRNRLLSTAPRTAAEELQLLAGASLIATPSVSGIPATRPKAEAPDAPEVPVRPATPPALLPSRPGDVVPGVRLRFDRGRTPRIELVGKGVDDALYRALKVWLVENTH